MADMTRIRALIDKTQIVESEAELQALFDQLRPDALTRPMRIAFVNAHALNLCHDHPAFLEDLLACDYVLRDGSGMKILYKLLGREPGLNLNGTDLIPRLLKLYQGKNAALFGTASPYLEKAAAKVTEMGINPVSVKDGFQDSDSYVQAVAGNHIQFVLLAMGMPKQEAVATKIAQADPAPKLIVCGGAILDFLAEKVKRAPDIYQRYGMEWLYRLKQEPRRLFNRYVVGNGVFLYRAFKLAKHQQRQRSFNVTNNDRGLKILHVVRQYAPAIGGLESYVQNMVRHQKSLGYDCEILTLDKVFHGHEGELPEFEWIEGTKVRRVSFWGRRRFFFPKVSPLYFGQYDVVHVHNTDMFYDYIALVAAITGTPCFATTHGGFFHTKDFSLIKTIYFNTVTRFSSLFYKAIFAISQNDFDTFNPLNKNVVLQPNAIQPLGEDIYASQDFIYIGRLAQHKYVNRAIAVFAKLKKDHGLAGKFHVVGPEWDVTVADLKETARQNGIEDDVVFHHAATMAQIREVASRCGYFLSASSFEGFGMSMLEAMSVGLVPFVHKNESFQELVTQSGVGMTADFEKTDDAATKIAAMLPIIDMSVRQRGQAFSRKFSWAELVQETDRYYKDALQ